MVKPAKIRGKFADEKFMGSEPEITSAATDLDVSKAYSWYNYFYSVEDAKSFAISYFKKKDKAVAEKISSIKRIPNYIGWNARIIEVGGSLPPAYEERWMQYINSLKVPAEAVIESEDDGPARPTISIQERIKDKALDLMGELAGEIDNIIEQKKNNKFSIKDFFTSNDIKAPVAAVIVNFYKPRYSELFDAINSKDNETKDAHKHLKKVLEFHKEVVAQAEARITISKLSRKPRQKKEKPKSVVVGKLQFLSEFKELKLKSINPTEIVGANTLWVYNVKTRTLFLYIASSTMGLSVKGTSILHWDEKLSQSKTLRKPEEQLEPVIKGGKIVLKRHMESIKTKSKEPSGRINKDMVLLRTVK